MNGQLPESSKLQPNFVTIQSYNEHAASYAERDLRDSKRAEAYWPGVEYFLDQLSPGEVIFEIGSGTGSDAQKIEAAGFHVRRSDAAEAFVNLLTQQGFRAETYDVLAGMPLDKFAAIFATAVLLHFTTEQFRQVLGNIQAGLLPGGLLCLGMKLGSFEGWRESNAKGKRYFKEWQTKDLEKELRRASFDVLHTFVASDGGFATFTVRQSSAQSAEK